jgi:lysyl-tRNA synthetase class 1
VVVTGISPSGKIHNLREVLVAEAVADALKARGEQTRFVFHADTIDPLRRIAPGVPKDYERYMGHSLSRIPDPEGCHESYAEHFLAPFEESLHQVGVEVEVLRSHELYESGFYTRVIREALDHTAELRAILQEVSGREMPEHWSPFLPRTASGRLGGVRVLEHIPEETSVVYADEDGFEVGADYSKGEGKLQWRVELAARWKALRVTFEPFGKDHTSRGGSTDTADRMSREVFDYPPPGRYEYEWNYLKGKGAMSSSKGIVVLPGDLLDIMPPDALRRLYLGRDPARALEIDLGAGFPRFIDEWRAENGESPVPFAHLVTVAQTVAGDTDRAAEMLRRGGYAEAAEDREGLSRDLEYARNWAQGPFAPEQYRLGVREELPSEVESLNEDQRRYLAAVAGRLGDEVDGDAAQDLLYSTAVEMGLKPKAAFGAVYTALLGRTSGPKAGPFVAGLGARFARERFREAAEGVPGGEDGR